MNHSICWLLVVSLACAPLSGCTAVYHFDKSQLDKLDGYERRDKSMTQRVMEGVGARESTSPKLVEEDGDVYEFDGKDPLVIVTRGPKNKQQLRDIEHLYLRIDVSETTFSGQPVDAPNTIEIQRDDIEATGTRRFSWARTAGLAAGIAVGALVGLIVLGTTIESDDSYDGDSGSGRDWD